MFSNSTLSCMIKNSSNDYTKVVDMVVNGIAQSESDFLALDKKGIVENGLTDGERKDINCLPFKIIKLTDTVFNSLVNIIQIQADQEDSYPCDLLAKHTVFSDLSMDRYEISYLLNSELDKKSIEYCIFYECLAWYAFDLVCRDFIPYLNEDRDKIASAVIN